MNMDMTASQLVRELDGYERDQRQQAVDQIKATIASARDFATKAIELKNAAK